MRFEEAVAEYRDIATTLIALRSALKETEERQAKLEAVLWMKDEVQAGSNEKARKALFEAACDQDDEYQGLLLTLNTQRTTIAEFEIRERIARKWMDYATAIARPVVLADMEVK